MIPYVSYRKIPIVSPGLIFVQKVYLWANFQGSEFSEGLIIGGSFAFQNDLGLTMKNAQNTEITA